MAARRMQMCRSIFAKYSYLGTQISSVFLCSHLAEAHQIFTRCSVIIYAVNAHIQTVILQRMQVALVGVYGIFSKSFDCHGNVPWEIGKRGTDLSSALKALSYGEKIVKIGPVYPEIRLNTPVFCHVVQKVHKWAPFSLELLDQSSRNLYTIEVSFTLLMRTLR